MIANTKINKNKFISWLASKRDAAVAQEKMAVRRGDYCTAMKCSVEREIYADLVTAIRFPDPLTMPWIEQADTEV